MSARENIEIFGLADEQSYADLLNGQFGAVKLSNQPGAYILDDPPSYAPRQSGDHIYILGFNQYPLPDSLIDALFDHPELFPNDILTRWTQEQDLLLDASLGQLTGCAVMP